MVQGVRNRTRGGINSIFSKFLFTAIVTATAAGCGNQSDQHASSTKVIGGLPVQDGEYPEVIRVTQGSGSCSASFVSTQTVITAAHCLEGSGQVRVTLNGTTHTASAFYLHPNYRTRWWEHDVAIVHFNNPVATEFMTIAAAPPVRGDELTIVGFGTDSLYGNGTFEKRKGDNVVEAVGGGRITFRGKDLPDQAPPGDDVLNAPGDSGGPMLVNGLQVGVSSAISVENRGLGRNGYYTDLNHAPNLAFLRNLVAQRKAVITFEQKK